MANGDSYCSVPEYRLAKGLQSGNDDLALEWQLAAVSRLLDLKLNQPYGFNVDETVTTRIYGARDQIAPIASTVGLIIKAATGAFPLDWPATTALVADTDYELLPRNPRAGWPYTGINLLTTGPSVISPSTYRGSVWGTSYRLQITALHGWPAVPEAIKESTIQLTAILRAESPFATDRIQELDQAVGTSLQARGILKSLYELYNLAPIGVG